MSTPRPSRATPARLAALEVLRLQRERDAYAHELIASRIDGSDLSTPDRAFATRLVLGVVSCQGTLDEVLDRSMNSPDDVKPDVRDALRISAYEIVFLRKSAHAAVDQGVELVRHVAPKAVRLANAVLRRTVELAKEFPFGDPSRDLAALARLYAFPEWLACRLVEELGAADAAAFMRASNEPAPLFVALNACAGPDEPTLRALERAGVEYAPALPAGRPVEGCYELSDARALARPAVERLLSGGRMLVSDAASQLVASAVLPAKRPESLLEIGAGRATKTILLQSAACRRWGAQIEGYVALDLHEFKTRLLLERAERYGVKVREAIAADALKLDEALGRRRFDVVFIDAPCSGLGTLRRHPEIRWRIRPESFAAFARTQLGMLRSAAGHVERGGVLAYATCTVAPEENTQVVTGFLKTQEGRSFTLAPIDGGSCVSTRLAPGSCDAHFAVRFLRVS